MLNLEKSALLLKVHLLILTKLPGVYKISFSCEATVNRRDTKPSKLRMQASAVRMSLVSFKLLCWYALVLWYKYTDHLKEKWMSLGEKVAFPNNSCLNKGKKGQWKRKQRGAWFEGVLRSLLERTRINALGCKIIPFSTERIKFNQSIFSDHLVTYEQCLWLCLFFFGRKHQNITKHCCITWKTFSCLYISTYISQIRQWSV